MRSAILAMLLCGMSSLAFGQAAVQQTGAITPFNLPRWSNDHQIEDAGGMQGKNGRGVNPFSVMDNNGPGVCYNTTLTSNPNNKTLCLGHNSAGTATFSINGTSYDMTGNGNTSGPNPSVVGLPALYGNNSGTLLSQATGTSDVAPGTFNAVTNSIIMGTAGRYLTPVYGSPSVASTSTTPAIHEQYFLGNNSGASYPWVTGHGITTVVPPGSNNKFAGLVSEVYTSSVKDFEQMAAVFHWYGVANQNDAGLGGGGEALWVLSGNGDGGPDAGCTSRAQPCVRATSAGAIEADNRQSWGDMNDLVPLSTRLVGTIGVGVSSGTLARCGGAIAGSGITIHGAGTAGANLITPLTSVGAMQQGGSCAVTWLAPAVTATTGTLVDVISDFTVLLPTYYMYGFNYGQDFSTFGATDAINIQGQSSAREPGTAISVGIRNVGYKHAGLILDSAVAYQDAPTNSVAANPIDILHGAHSTIKEAYFIHNLAAIGWTWQTIGNKLLLCGATCTNEFVDFDTSNGIMNIAAQPVNWLTSGGAPGQISGTLAQANLIFSSGTFGDFGIRSPGLLYFGSTALGTNFAPSMSISSSSVNMGTPLIFSAVAAAPATPAAGTFTVYMLAGDSKLYAKGPSGTTTVLAPP